MNRNSGRKTDGTFAAGNPGRPRGARHKVTLAVEALLEGEAEVLTRKAIELALQGDTVALRLCLDRILPPRKDAAVAFDLPTPSSAQEAAIAAQAVLQATSEGSLAPTEAAAVMSLVERYARVLELSEFEGRLSALESAAEVKP